MRRKRTGYFGTFLENYFMKLFYLYILICISYSLMKRKLKNVVSHSTSKVPNTSSLFCATKDLLVCLSGHNGTIDGQGKMWWDLWWNKTLVHTRGHLVELVNSHNILISNLTFRDSPFWTIHPVYCRCNILLIFYH